MGRWLKRLVWIAGLALLVLLVVRAFRPVPLLVELGEVRRDALSVTVDDDGHTRVRERYTISAPIGGRLVRTVLDPGDVVVADETVVAEFERVPPALLDARARSEAEARVKRAEAALAEAQAQREQAAADLGFAEAQLARARELRDASVRSQEELERAELEQQRAYQGVRAATFAQQVAEFELELARASLIEPEGADLVDPERLAPDGAAPAAGRLLLRSPIDGRVLRVFEESARTMSVGTPILEVGNTEALEIVAEYLSQDAVKVEPGMPVRVEGWGGEAPGGEEHVLHGRVRVVEPGGFTKVSALGVEEQRVRLVVDPLGDEETWARLGDGYHVELRIEVWAGTDLLLVPAGALFRERGEWHVYVADGGRARLRAVELGRRTGLDAQVLDGLAEGDEVVLYPSEAVADGVLLEAR